MRRKKSKLQFLYHRKLHRHPECTPDGLLDRDFDGYYVDPQSFIRNGYVDVASADYFTPPSQDELQERRDRGKSAWQ